MSDLPMALYSYSSNFNGSPKSTKRPYTPSFKVKLQTLLIPDWEYIIPTLERRIAVLQWFLETAKPIQKDSLYNSLKYIGNNFNANNDAMALIGSAYEISRSVQKKVQELLMRVNVDNDVWIWREATGLLDISAEVTIPIRTYRYRAAMPIKAFESFENILDTTLKIEPDKCFGWQPNNSHPEAIHITNVGYQISTGTNKFFYGISYGYKNDSSSWQIYVQSNSEETFVDFVLRISKALPEIFSTGECLEAENSYSRYYSIKETSVQP